MIGVWVIASVENYDSTTIIILIHIFGKHMHNELGINPGVELLDHQVYTFLASIVPAMWIYNVVLPISAPTSSCEHSSY